MADPHNGTIIGTGIISAALHWKMCRIEAMQSVTPATFKLLADAEAALVAAISEFVDSRRSPPTLHKESH